MGKDINPWRVAWPAGAQGPGPAVAVVATTAWEREEFIRLCGEGISPALAALAIGADPRCGPVVAWRMLPDICQVSGLPESELLEAWLMSDRAQAAREREQRKALDAHLAQRRADAERLERELASRPVDATWLMAELRRQYKHADEAGDRAGAVRLLKLIGEHCQVSAFGDRASTVTINISDNIRDARKRVAAVMPDALPDLIDAPDD